MALICQHKLSAPLNKSRRHARRNFLILNSQENSRMATSTAIEVNRQMATRVWLRSSSIAFERHSFRYRR